MRTVVVPLGQLVSALCLIAFVAHANAADFRNAQWGMTMGEIVALHADQLPADRRLGRIAYDGKLANLDVLIYYHFDAAGALEEAGYEVQTEDREPLTTISDYKTLNSLLMRKYQQAQAPQMIWSNRMFESKPDEWGRAVRIGHLTYEWSHTLERTTIRHSLSGTRRSIKHVLRYEALEQQSGQDALEQL